MFSVTETNDNTATVKILKAINALFYSENSRQKEITASGSRWWEVNVEQVLAHSGWQKRWLGFLQIRIEGGSFIRHGPGQHEKLPAGKRCGLAVRLELKDKPSKKTGFQAQRNWSTSWLNKADTQGRKMMSRT